VNVEKDRRNYDNLVAETKKREGEQLQVVEILPADVGNGVRRFARPPLTGPRVVVINLHGSFAEAATSVLAAPGEWPPTLFFIDPIGITGVPFAVVRGLLRLPRTEVMFTFMVQAARRFLDLPHLQPGLVSLFGTEECLKIRDELGLLGLYMQQLKQSSAAQWVWPFRVMETRRRETLYYLIHASNHFLAFKIMKGIMWAAGAPGEFAFLGPDDQAAREQLALFPDEWLEPFKDWLLETFARRTLTFEEAMRETYDKHNLIEKHYRQAVLSLEHDGKVTINRLGEKRTGKPALKYGYYIRFPGG
jgi:hypothetical protein